MKTGKKIKETLEKAGVKRVIIKRIDYNNVEIYAPQNNHQLINRTIDQYGVFGVNYQVIQLPFWKCWFEKYQIIG